MAELIRTESLGVRKVVLGAAAAGAFAMGAIAFSALAIGALAVGRMALGRVAVGKTKFKSLELDDLTMKRLRASEISITDSLDLPSSAVVLQPASNDLNPNEGTRE